MNSLIWISNASDAVKTRLERLSPNMEAVHSHSISPLVVRARDCSARDLRRSVSSGDQAPCVVFIDAGEPTPPMIGIEDKEGEG